MMQATGYNYKVTYHEFINKFKVQKKFGNPYICQLENYGYTLNKHKTWSYGKKRERSLLI